MQSNTSWKSCCQTQVEQVQHACECHVCNQDPTCTNLGSTTCLPPSRLHAAPPPTVGHQFFTDSNTPSTHPALHLYPHIHGHLPLHNFSRPLLHPTLYPPSPPLTHNKVRKELTVNLHTFYVPVEVCCNFNRLPQGVASNPTNILKFLYTACSQFQSIHMISFCFFPPT